MRSNLRIGDLLGSYPRCARVKSKCAGKTCIGLWGQSTISMSSHRRSVGPGCYNGALTTLRVWKIPKWCFFVIFLAFLSSWCYGEYTRVNLQWLLLALCKNILTKRSLFYFYSFIVKFTLNVLLLQEQDQ